jgi:hypothetical protein
MPYISRNGQGEIVELHDSPIENGDQWMEANNPEVLAFLKRIERTDQVKHILTSTDHDMLRVVEDLIDLLMEKQMFTYTELPEAVQLKLNARKQLRKDMNMLGGLINDDDTIF